mmetsp:Transcript_49619/g.117745  ORF Transcript_49619/g.117745 Transcript_49619/m.117745 type:complete len:115 (-) Transcript_49619:32-376(-)
MFTENKADIKKESLGFFDDTELSNSRDFFKIVHIRLHQRNGRKSLTTIQGLCDVFDFERITKALKKEFCCNGCVVEDKELGTIIQLQGDQRENSKKFLTKERISNKKIIKIHGI